MFDRRQSGILADRYMDCLLGDFSSLLWMIGQAPLIAGLIILRWNAWHSTDSLFFVMTLSALWFGCINSCRELARELAIYQRERLFGLDRAAYLVSKLKILSLLGLLEMGIFFVLLNSYLDLDLSPLPAFLILFTLYFAGTALGLLLSRLLGSVARAVVAVPIVLLPQIIFSKFVLPAASLKGLAAGVSNFMMAKWGLQALTACRREQLEWQDMLAGFACVLGLAAVCLIIAYMHMLVFDNKTADETA